jgi:hypothetical protein
MNISSKAAKEMVNTVNSNLEQYGLQTDRNVRAMAASLALDVKRIVLADVLEQSSPLAQELRG